MRPRRFPRKPISPKFKIAIAFDLPIDLVIGLPADPTTYVTPLTLPPLLTPPLLEIRKLDDDEAAELVARWKREQAERES